MRDWVRSKQAEITKGLLSFIVYTIKMLYEFDPNKDRLNFQKHGLSFAEAENFEWDSALVRKDTRRIYAEPRFQALGLIGQRVHVLVFCLRGDAVRIISLRKAHSKEVASYDSQH